MSDTELSEVIEEPTPGATIDLRDNPGVRFFKDWQEVFDFLSMDITEWGPFFSDLLTNFRELGNPFLGLHSEHQNLLQSMVNQVNQLKAQKPLDSSMTSVLETLFQPYLAEKCIHSKSKVGDIILGHDGPTPTEKFGAYVYYINRDPNRKLTPVVVMANGQMGRQAFPGVQFISGIAAAKLYDLGLGTQTTSTIEKASALIKTLESQVSTWGIKTSALDSEHVKIKQNSSNLFQEFEGGAKKLVDEFRQTTQDQASSFQSLYKNHEDALASIRASFSEEMRLRAARSYWGDLESNSQRKAKTFWVLFLISVPLSLATILGSMFAVSWALKYVDLVSQSSEWLVVGLPTVLNLWVVRSIHRQWSTYQGLANDAKERVTMLETYLALVSEGNMADVERPMVLQPLFRPNSVVGDDGMYKGIIDHLIDAVNKTGKP